MIEDKILVWRYNSGDTRVLRGIYDKYKNCLLTVAVALLYDKSEAEDVIHDVFFRLSDTQNPLHIKGCLKAYLSTAVANSARTRNAKKRPLSFNDTEIFENAKEFCCSSPDLKLISGERSENIKKAINVLSFENREVLMLRLYCDMTFREISQSRQISTTAVQNRYQNAITQLRSLLNGELE